MANCVGDKYVIDLALSYRQFKLQNRLTEIGNTAVQNWMNSVINNYLISATPEDVMTFFHIEDTPENREWVTARKYNITGLITAQDEQKDTIVFHLTLEVKESSILIG